MLPCVRWQFTLALLIPALSLALFLLDVSAETLSRLEESACNKGKSSSRKTSPEHDTFSIALSLYERAPDGEEQLHLREGTGRAYRIIGKAFGVHVGTSEGGISVP